MRTLGVTATFEPSASVIESEPELPLRTSALPFLLLTASFSACSSPSFVGEQPDGSVDQTDSGSDAHQDDSDSGVLTPEPDGEAPHANCDGGMHGDRAKRTRFRSSVGTAAEPCQSEEQTRTCGDGSWSSWSGSFEAAACTSNACADQADGTVQRQTRYLVSKVPYGESCTSELQERECKRATWTPWTGSFQEPACFVESVCGDGRLDARTERCDDGNEEDGDGCSSGCVVEPEHVCESEETKLSTCVSCAVRVNAASLASAPDGNTWAGAYEDLTDAFARASELMSKHGCAHSEVWLQQGVYRPDASAPFALPDNVNLYGGFVGTEQHREQRPNALSWLSGDLKANDDDSFESHADNRMRVLTVSDLTHPAVIEGVGVRSGFSEDDGADLACIVITRADLTLRDSAITDCHGISAAGVAVSHATLTIERTRFERNQSVTGGSALVCAGDDNSSCRLRDVTFAHNKNRGWHATVEVHSGAFVGTNVRFEDNEAQMAGAVGLLVLDAYAYLANSRFTGNRGIEGKAVVASGQMQVVNSIFVSNEAAALSNGANANFCAFDDNRGVALDTGNASPYTVYIGHSLVWTGGFGVGPASVDHSWLEDEQGVLQSRDNLVRDPSGFDFMPSQGSPAVDFSDPDFLPPFDSADLDGDGDWLEPVPFDMDGRPRNVGSGADLGPYEFQP